MKILDRYILKKFLRSFLFILVLLSMVIILIDFTEKNGEFIHHRLSTGEIMGYYGAYVFFIINFITPFTVFVAAMSVTSRLARHAEVIAMLSGGVSLSRLLLPYMVGATIITGGSFYLTGWGLPKANVKRIAFETEYNIDHSFSGRSSHLHIRVNAEQYLYLERYRASDHSGTNVAIETIKELQLHEKLSASKIIWLEEIKKWRLEQWERRTIKEGKEYIQQGDYLDLALDLAPTDFSINPRLHETLTLPELDQHIVSLKAKGQSSVHRFLVEKYVRYMTPFSALLLTFIGVIIAARKSRGGAGLQLVLGFMLAFAYIACFLFAKGIAEAKGTYPLLTVWTPNIIFASISLVLYRILPR